jgi:hypothetical protein
MRKVWICVLLAATSPAWAQPGAVSIDVASIPAGDGWHGFLNVAFLVHTFLTLVLAAVLGAVLGYHPRHIQSADTLIEIEAPKVYVLYAVIGAIVGILVVKYTLVVGFVLFGIGGLIRFRSIPGSANVTGRVIFVTLIGLACGLDLPHVAVLATLFAFGLIFLLESRQTYRVDVQVLTAETVAESAAAYRKLFEECGCRVLSEKKRPLKQRVTFLVSGPSGVSRQVLQDRIDEGIAGPLKGAVDWQTD